ncbi:putative transport protein HsrA [compost metagenome]
MTSSAALPKQGVNRSAVKVVICLGAFLSNLSAGMFNIALVDISAELRIPVASAQWVVSIYLLVISVLLPVMGRLGDMLGRRRVHNLGLFAFAAGALGCALAPNAALLLTFRVLQGIGASMYQATNMALIVSVFPGDQRGRALGLMSTFVAAGSMAGPGLGGFLIQWFSWESNFWLLAAVAAVVGVLAQRLIPPDTELAGGKLDIGRAVWFAACLSSLMIAVDLGGRSSFLSLPVLLLFAAAGAAGAGYAAHARSTHGTGGGAAEAEGAYAAADAPMPGQAKARGPWLGRAGAPAPGKGEVQGESQLQGQVQLQGQGEVQGERQLQGQDQGKGKGQPQVGPQDQLRSRAVSISRKALPPSGGQGMFADRSFTVGIAITVITYMAAFTAQLALPSVLRLSGAEPALVGLIMIGYPLALVVTAPFSGSLSDRKGPLGILTAGLLLMCGTLLALGLAAPALGAGAMVLPVVLLGCAMGMITSPNTSIVMGLAPKSELGRVSSILALSRNIGMMFGTAAGGMVISGGASGPQGSYMAVFLTCAAAVGLSSAWLLYALRRSGKRKGLRV